MCCYKMAKGWRTRDFLRWHFCIVPHNEMSFYDRKRFYIFINLFSLPDIWKNIWTFRLILRTCPNKSFSSTTSRCTMPMATTNSTDVNWSNRSFIGTVNIGYISWVILWPQIKSDFRRILLDNVLVVIHNLCQLGLYLNVT